MLSKSAAKTNCEATIAIERGERGGERVLPADRIVWTSSTPDTSAKLIGMEGHTDSHVR